MAELLCMLKTQNKVWVKMSVSECSRHNIDFCTIVDTVYRIRSNHGTSNYGTHTSEFGHIFGHTYIVIMP